MSYSYIRHRASVAHPGHFLPNLENPCETPCLNEGRKHGIGKKWKSGFLFYNSPFPFFVILSKSFNL
jgi:hypothetical protein